MVLQSKSGFFAPLKARQRGKKNRYAKTPVFDNKLHNEVATYSKSTTIRHIYTVTHVTTKSSYNEIPAYNEVVY